MLTSADWITRSRVPPQVGHSVGPLNEIALYFSRSWRKTFTNILPHSEMTHSFDVMLTLCACICASCASLAKSFWENLAAFSSGSCQDMPTVEAMLVIARALRNCKAISRWAGATRRAAKQDRFQSGDAKKQLKQFPKAIKDNSMRTSAASANLAYAA